MKNFHELNSYQKVSYIFVNIEAFIGLLGIVGNLLSICVFSQNALKNHSYSFYWRILATSDILVLLSTFKLWANLVLDIRLQTMSPLLCTINEYHTYVASFISTWLLALISIDRFLVIVCPNRFKLFRRRSVQLTLVCVVILYCVLINLRIPLNNRFDSNHASCYLPRPIQNFNSYLILANTFLVHIVINSVLDVKVYMSIRNSRKKSHRIVNSLQSTVRDRKFAVSTIALNVSSCLLKLPFIIGIYVSTCYQLTRDQQQAIFIVSGAIAILDNCDLFFINMFVNSVFYREFWKMVAFK